MTWVELTARELATLRALLQAHQNERDSLGCIDMEEEDALTDAELAALLERLGGA